MSKEEKSDENKTIGEVLYDFAERYDPPWHAFAVQTLCSLISELSEEGWCASWGSGVHFEAWDVAFEGRTEIGRYEVEPSEREALVSLHKLIGGWVTREWGDDAPRFVTTAEWQSILSERQ